MAPPIAKLKVSVQRSKGLEKLDKAKTQAEQLLQCFQGPLLLCSPKLWFFLQQLGDRQGCTSKGTNKPVIIANNAQELLQLLDTCRGGPVLHRLKFLLIHLKFAKAYNMSEIFYLRLAKFIFLYLGIQLFFPKLLQYRPQILLMLSGILTIY